MTTGGILLITACIAAAAIFFNYYEKKKRREYLFQKYRDMFIVKQIMNKIIWQGMTEEQLIDSWGRPDSKDVKLYKTKTSEIFKYNRTGKNRYLERVTVENGTVVGWHQRRN